MGLKKVREGKIELSVPEGRIYDAPAFFNPEGELNRDISISAIQAFQKDFGEKITIADVLAGTGARGLRCAKEIEGVKKVLLNDKNPTAVKLIRKNAAANKLTRKCKVTNEDASLLMRNNVFICIDLDPFGPPSTFLDSAARSIYHKGFLCVTATDQSALSGTYPESCLRKYGIRSIKTEFYNELGTRILITSIILNAARYDKAFVPVLSLSNRQYYKAFGRIEHAGKLSDILKEFGYVNYCPKCGYRSLGKMECQDKEGHKLLSCGLVYIGKINDKAFCKKVLDDLENRDFEMKKEEKKLLKTIIEEADMPAFYYDMHSMSKKTKKSTPNFDKLMESLKKSGFRASRTHFCATAIKTDASHEEMRRLF